MKALSFRQPWAELILQGRKTIDLRTWPTKYRGRIAIHASKQVDQKICDHYGLDRATLPTGALVGTVEVVEMVALDETAWERLREQHLKPGPFPGDLLGWRLAEPQRLATPVPARGRLRLFNVADVLLDPSAPGSPPATPPVTPPPKKRPPQTDKGATYQTGTEAAYDPDKPFELRVTAQADERSPYRLSLYQWPVAIQSHTRNGHHPDEAPRQPQRLAELSGDSLRAVADHILVALRHSGYKATDLSAQRRKPFYLDEETGLRLGLLFLAIKPLTRLDRIEAISSALRTMPSEEAYYWFSKCTAAATAANAQRALRILLAGE